LTQARDSDSIRLAHTACSARGSRPRGADLQKPPRCATAGGFVTNQRSLQSLFEFAIPASNPVQAEPHPRRGQEYFHGRTVSEVSPADDSLPQLLGFLVT
jgi:hypothetical protein